MCGIAGALRLDGRPADRSTVSRMGEILHHRGPDGEGVHIDGPLGFAHRRLAVIDPSSAGAQPMVTSDGRFALNYNGELYNSPALRMAMERDGHAFRGHSDTEVVLRTLADRGAEAVEDFNGMFALALWDRDRRELILARDRFGVKPLYYTLSGDDFLFASEVKALLAHPSCRAEMDPEALVEYLTFQNFFTDRTLFRGVHLLPPGSILRVVPGRGVIGPVRYWDFDFQEPDDAADAGEYLDELDRLFRQAVNRQLLSDVPVNAYLSGGMDSGSITAIAASNLPNLRTFTVGFDLHSASGIEIGFDERSRAEHMSYLFHTEHYEMVLKAGDMERAMRRLMWHLEEPRIGQSYPNFYAAQLASKFGKVVLSGAGGDELFGGYPWRYYRAVVNDDFEHYIDNYFGFWQRLVPAEAMESLTKPMSGATGHVSPRDIFKDVFGGRATHLERPEDYVKHSLYMEAKTFLHGLLVVEDKLSMAHGLETRVPFLDNDLVDFAQRIPVRLVLGDLDTVVRLNENELGAKARTAFQHASDGKWLFRQAMARYLPVEVTTREKQGFSAPDASWFRGESIDYVRRLLFSGDPMLYEYLDRSTVEHLVDDHFAGRENRRLFVWSLVCLEHWCQIFLGNETKDSDGPH